MDKIKLYSIISKPGSDEKDLIEERPWESGDEETIGEYKQNISDEWGQRFVDCIVLTEEELELIGKKIELCQTGAKIT